MMYAIELLMLKSIVMHSCPTAYIIKHFTKHSRISHSRKNYRLYTCIKSWLAANRKYFFMDRHWLISLWVDVKNYGFVFKTLASNKILTKWVRMGMFQVNCTVFYLRDKDRLHLDSLHAMWIHNVLYSELNY